MKFYFLIVFSLLLSVFGINSASGFEKSSFTAHEIEKLIADWPGFFAWYKNKKPWKKMNLKGNNKIIMVRDGVFFFKGVEDLPEVVNYLKGQGWRSKYFFYIINQASKGLAYLDMKEDVPKQQASMQKEIETLRKDKHMPATVRKQVITDLKEAVADLEETLQEMRIPDEQLTVIKRYSAPLKQIF